MRLPKQLLSRKTNSHKGDFGHIFILAGSLRFSGAALLCAESALRCGAGLVTLGVPEKLVNAIIRVKPKELMLLPLSQTPQGSFSVKSYKKIKDFLKKIDVLIIGPGLGQHSSTQKLVRKIVTDIDKPMVLDADGLNALAGHLEIFSAIRSKPFSKILTPHPGEIARLLGKSIEEIQKNRKNIARSFAIRYNCILVLKGNKTVIADHKGKIYINNTGNPGMATAGSGDVLTGIIASFLGQGLDAFSAAKYAVYLHGLAGDLAAEEKTELGMIASDIIEKIPEAIKISS